MPRYRTEIVVPPDRYVCLRLPDESPEGRAIVTVDFTESNPALALDSTSSDLGIEPIDHDADREDIEWWEEFDGDALTKR